MGSKRDTVLNNDVWTVSPACGMLRSLDFVLQEETYQRWVLRETEAPESPIEQSEIKPKSPQDREWIAV